MARRGVAFTNRDEFDRMSAAVRRTEQMWRSDEFSPAPDGQYGAVPVDVQITSATATAGLYPGKFVAYNQDTGSWYDLDDGTCRVKDVGGGALINGARYKGTITGVTNEGSETSGTNNGYPIVTVVLPGGRSPSYFVDYSGDTTVPLTGNVYALNGSFVWTIGTLITDLVYPIQVRDYQIAFSNLVDFPVFPGATGLIYPDSGQPTKYALLPFQYADYYVPNSTYYGGMLKPTGAQRVGASVTWDGAAYFNSDATVNGTFYCNGKALFAGGADAVKTNGGASISGGPFPSDLDVNAKGPAVFGDSLSIILGGEYGTVGHFDYVMISWVDMTAYGFGSSCPQLTMNAVGFGGGITAVPGGFLGGGATFGEFISAYCLHVWDAGTVYDGVSYNVTGSLTGQPSFKGGILINAGSGFGGTVTSVDVSGGTTGLTFSGGPVSTSGTLTMSGTLGQSNGGTGQTSFLAALGAAGGSATSGSLTP